MTPERIQVQVLMADLLLGYHYLQVVDQVLGIEDDAEARKILGRVRVAAAMLRRSCTDLVQHVTQLDSSIST